MQAHLHGAWLGAGRALGRRSVGAAAHALVAEPRARRRGRPRRGQRHGRERRGIAGQPLAHRDRRGRRRPRRGLGRPSRCGRDADARRAARPLPHDGAHPRVRAGGAQAPGREPALGHAAPLDRPGGLRRRRLRRARGHRPHHDDAPRPRPLPRQGRAAGADVRRADGPRGRLLQGPLRLDAHRRQRDRQPRRERDRGRRHPDRGRRGVRVVSARGGLRRRLVLRRGRGRRGRVPREPQHRRAVEAAGRARVREQPLRRALARGRRARGARHLVARGAVRDAGERVDGNDVEAVADAARRAVARGRAGEGPTLLELDTYRQSGHFEGDQMRYRTKEEAAEWAERDPLLARRRAPRRRGGDGRDPRRRRDGDGRGDRVGRGAARGRRPASLFDDVYAEPSRDARSSSGRRSTPPSARSSSAIRASSCSARTWQGGRPVRRLARAARPLRRGARPRHADRRGRDHRRRGRRGHVGPAPGGRDHVLRLRHAGHGPARQPGREDALHVRRQALRADDGAHVRRLGTRLGAAALAEPRSLARARPRPLGRLPLEPRRREGPAQDGDPLRGSGRLRRVVATLDDARRGPRGRAPRADRQGRDRAPRLRRDARLVGLGGRAHARGGGDPGRAGIDAEVLDLRTISPLDETAILESVGRTGRLVVVHDAAGPFGPGARSPRSSPSTPSTRCALRSRASPRRSRPHRSRTSSSTPTTRRRSASPPRRAPSSARCRSHDGRGRAQVGPDDGGRRGAALAQGRRRHGDRGRADPRARDRQGDRRGRGARERRARGDAGRAGQLVEPGQLVARIEP